MGAADILNAAMARMRALREDAGAAAALVQLAAFAAADADAHTCEMPRGSNKGPDLKKFFLADDYKPAKDEGYPWCAAAVSYWVQTWLENCAPAKLNFGHIKPPRTARAFGLSEWAKGPAKGCVEIITPGMLRGRATKALPGDIAVFEISHCGIVIAGSFEWLTCGEGNTGENGSREGWVVAKRPRTPSELRHLLRMIPRALPA